MWSGSAGYSLLKASEVGGGRHFFIEDQGGALIQGGGGNGGAPWRGWEGVRGVGSILFSEAGISHQGLFLTALATEGILLGLA